MYLYFFYELQVRNQKQPKKLIQAKRGKKEIRRVKHNSYAMTTKTTRIRIEGISPCNSTCWIANEAKEIEKLENRLLSGSPEG